MYLNCHTYFSLKYGTLSPQQLVAEGVEKGAEILALTDINNTSAVFDFISACKKAGIKPLVGIEFRNAGELLYIGLAKNNEGFRELNAFLSGCNSQHSPLPSQAPAFNNVCIIYPWAKKRLEALSDNEFIGIKITDINKFIVSPLSRRQEKFVLLHPVTFKNMVGYNTHRLLRAIDNNTLLSKLGPREHAGQEEVMLPIDTLLEYYGRFPQIVKNTMELMESCNIDLDSGNKNRKTFTGDPYADKLLLENLAMQGFQDRYGSNNKAARERVLKELEIIDRLGFNAYFLITEEITGYATKRGFAYVGRGSGANSIVAYCLKLSEVDPIELDLYFERFLNPYRASPPDFDIDFCWNERDEVTKHIFEKYQYTHTALLATCSTFRNRAPLRELGKVFGLPKAEIDALVNIRYKEELENKDELSKRIIKYAGLIQDFPNHLSIHAGGVLITENPIFCYTATDLPPKNFPIVHFDMYTAEENGFYKYDILSQRGLGHIKDAKKIIRQNQGQIVRIETEACKADEKIKDYIKKANTIGCFYVESPAMRMLLKKLQCDDYLTLVAASSIIRPGVASSGMMQEYIKRYHNPDRIQYLHPKMKELLSGTFGVMVYQEDVIKVAHYWAGIDLGEADMLRRAMSGKYKGLEEIMKVEKRFFESCKEQGHPEVLSKEVWRQIKSFSGYSFNKAHSASFAVESYHSLFLKVYYPLEFMVAVINNWGGFYGREFYFHEARMAGAEIMPPCVNHSDNDTAIIGKTIYTGFAHMKNMEHKLVEAIVWERTQNGKYKSLQDFVKRIQITTEQLNLLIRVGAFRFTGKTKKVLLLETALLFSKAGLRNKSTELFEPEMKEVKLPKLRNFTYEDAFDEMEILGFPLCFPFDLLPAAYKEDIRAKEMMQHVNSTRTMIGYFVTVKDSSTKYHELMAFGHFIDRDGNTFDTTHFPPCLKHYPFQGKGFYKLTGKIVQEFDYPSMEVTKMEKLPLVKKEVIYD